jgi:hypothetical protein
VSITPVQQAFLQLVQASHCQSRLYSRLYYRSVRAPEALLTNLLELKVLVRSNFWVPYARGNRIAKNGFDSTSEIVVAVLVRRDRFYE